MFNFFCPALKIHFISLGGTTNKLKGLTCLFFFAGFYILLKFFSLQEITDIVSQWDSYAGNASFCYKTKCKLGLVPQCQGYCCRLLLQKGVAGKANYGHPPGPPAAHRSGVLRLLLVIRSLVPMRQQQQ